MVYIFLADGFEEIEALTQVDYLRRAGVEVITVGITGKTVTGAHNISVVCDITENDAVLDEKLEMKIMGKNLHELALIIIKNHRRNFK